MLYIVVPTYNRIIIFQKFIEQLNKQTSQDYYLVVVDHGTVKTNYMGQKTTVLDGDPNGWWTHTVNTGLDYILNKLDAKDGDHVLVINDDVVMQEDYIEEIHHAIKEKPNACIGSVCYDVNTKKVLHVNMVFNRIGAKFDYHNQGIKLKELDKEYYESDVLKGRGTIFPVFMIRKIGLYNEDKLPHYKADHELPWRAKQNGYEVLVSSRLHLGAVLDSPTTIQNKNNFLTNYRNIFFNIRSTRSLKDLWNYSFCSFSFFYAWYYYLVNLLRMHFVFVLTYSSNKK